MKILLVHVYYQFRGGEDAVFEQECELLRENNEVETLIFYNNAGIKGAAQFLLSIWNFLAAGKLREVIRNFKPDILHLHNWHFAAGPIIIRTAKKMGVPIVLTLHNYRLLCPSATFMSDGHIFTSSLKSSFPWEAIRRKVYRNSLLQTFWLALIVFYHKKIGTWSKVTKYITLTDFARELFLNSNLGVTEDKFIVKPNFVTDKSGVVAAKKHFLFVGRLSEEKGLVTLLKSFSEISSTLRIAGKGTMQNDVEQAIVSSSNIDYLGDLSADLVKDQMLECSALIFPSIWYEGMPMTIIEAFSSSTPIIASNLGSMASMITHGYNGLLFEPGDTNDLKEKLQFWDNLSDTEKSVFRTNARDTYEKHYMPKQNLAYLQSIYSNII